MEYLRVAIKFKYAFCVPRLVTGGGLAMFWNDEVDLRVVTFSKNHIDSTVVVKETGKSFVQLAFMGIQRLTEGRNLGLY